MVLPCSKRSSKEAKGIFVVVPRPNPAVADSLASAVAFGDVHIHRVNYTRKMCIKYTRALTRFRTSGVCSNKLANPPYVHKEQTPQGCVKTSTCSRSPLML